MDLFLDPHQNLKLPLMMKNRSKQGSKYEDLFQFFQSFAKLERLNLIGRDFPKVKVDVPGALTMIASYQESRRAWEKKDFACLAQRKVLGLRIKEQTEGETLSEVVSACSPNLLHLGINDYTIQGPLQLDLPNLNSLTIVEEYWNDLLDDIEVPKVRHFEASHDSLLSLSVRNSNSLRIRMWAKKRLGRRS